MLEIEEEKLASTLKGGLGGQYDTATRSEVQLFFGQWCDVQSAILKRSGIDLERHELDCHASSRLV